MLPPFVQNHGMDLGASHNPATHNVDVADWYRETANRWACYGCSRPTEVRYYPTRDLPPVFRCPVNRYAPFAGSENCASFEAIPGYDELCS